MEFDRQSMSSMGRGGRIFERPGSDIKKTGYMKKLKTMKKKFFVLRSTSSSGPARLEYFDNEKKYNSGNPPKRSIQLHTCFNINRKTDSRNCKNGIVLYTSEDCFVVLAESEEEQDAWLSTMLEYQTEYLPDEHKEHYENVWQLTLQPKGLGKDHKGSYRLCLNTTTACLVKMTSKEAEFSIQLVTIRQVSSYDCSFRMEVGKYAPTGEGTFFFTVEDPNVAKDMHETLLHYMNSVKEPSLKKEHISQFRTRSESHSTKSPNRHRNSKAEQRPQSFYTPPSNWQSMDTTSPVGGPVSFHPSDLAPPHPHRPRSDTGDSRVSRCSSQFEDSGHEIIATYNGDLVDNIAIKDDKQHITIVPADMSPPPSPSGLDDEINAYLEMEPGSKPSSGSIVGTPPAFPGPGGSVYLPMNLSMSSHSHLSQGELSPSVSDGGGYMPTNHSALSHSPPASIPIHSHIYGDSHHTPHSSHSAHPVHPPPLPTVREGGSNEGYLPMDLSSSPSSSSIPRPDPAKCMLSDDNSGLPPRTYSLGSKPVSKKYSGYMDMVPRKGSMGNDISRAMSAPHIINKGRRDRDREHHHTMDSPTPSPLSMSVKSDDSDSFMEYMPMRPRTASDSFNYRPRTSSFSKLQPASRPRSSSHGQGTRPFTKVNKLVIEQARISQDPLQRMSRESSLHGSFDSLRVSNESLRRMSQDSRYSPVVNEQDELRGSSPLSGRNSKNDSYMSMDVSSAPRKSSPHRVRTDSSSSGRRSEKMTNSDRSLHSQDNSTYTEMTPVNSRAVEGDSYMNMGFNNSSRQSAPTPGMSTSLQSSRISDAAYMNMDTSGDSKGRSDSIRSASLKNVDTYVTYDPAPMGHNKPRTGSLGSKDKKIAQSLKKSSSISPSSHQHHHEPTVSASTRKGGSSDSLRKTSRQSSMEKYGSLGKDFRKKSGSTGSRPINSKSGELLNSSSMMPMRNPPARLGKDDPSDEYIEFAPNVSLGENESIGVGRGNISANFSSGQSRVTGSQHGAMIAAASARLGLFNAHAHSVPQPIDDSAYTPYSPAVPPTPHNSLNVNDDSSYMPFAPGPQTLSKSPLALQDQLYLPKSGAPFSSSSSSFNTLPHTQAKQIAAKDLPDYVGFDPSPNQHPPIPPPLAVQPTSAFSYIVGNTNSTSSSNPRQKNLKSQHSSLDSSRQTQWPEQKHGPTNPGIPTSTSLTFDPSSFFSDPSSPQQPPSASLSSSSVQLPKPESVPSWTQGTTAKTFKKSASSPKAAVDDSDYVSCSRNSSSPFKAAVDDSDYVSCSRNSASPFKAAVDDSDYVSCSRNSASPFKAAVDDSDYVSCSRNSASSFKAAVDESDYISCSRNSASSFKADIDDSEYIRCSPGIPIGNLGTNSQLIPSVSFISENKTSEPDRKQLSFVGLGHDMKSDAVKCNSSGIKMSGQPLCQSENAGKPHAKQIFQQQCLQKQPTPPLFIGTDAQASISSDQNISPSQLLPSSSSPSPQVSENTPPWNASRHKHSSGSSNSSQKSRKISGDSDKSLKKGPKSDSNSSLSSSGGRSKRRAASGEKSPGGNSDKVGPLSPLNGDEFSWSGHYAGKHLEGKMVHVEAKIRHSLGDVTDAVDSVSNKENPSQGLVRPGSTPCIQHLESSSDDMTNKSVDSLSTLKIANSSKKASRSRHSLSDLGAYQQIAPGSFSPVASNVSPASTSTSTATDSVFSDQPEKVLNYAQLDLSNPPEGENEGKMSKAKSKDLDDKQPPLSYAKIDFEKCQNMKTLSLEGGAQDVSKS